MIHRIGCLPAANLAWSPDGSSIAHNCGSGIHVLALRGSGFATVPTGSGAAFWPTWLQDGKDGSKQHLASDYGDATWYGALPGRPSWRAIH